MNINILSLRADAAWNGVPNMAYTIHIHYKIAVGIKLAQGPDVRNSLYYTYLLSMPCSLIILLQTKN